jgi:hypothetical protein
MPKGIYPGHELTPQSLLKRLTDKSIPEPNSGCWIYMGNLDRYGYGRISTTANNPKPAHRISYELHKGEIPCGLFVLHSCDNRCCVNPDHLRLGSHKDNMREMCARGRHRSQTAKMATPLA